MRPRCDLAKLRIAREQYRKEMRRKIRAERRKKRWYYRLIKALKLSIKG